MQQAVPKLILLACALMVTHPAAARVRALVVGVSQYDRVDLADAALPGAATDATAVADRLRGHGGDVTLLTGSAARASAITQALSGLVATSRPGDRVVIYLAGHGVQAPARGNDEPDGLDEWFVGADAGSWNARRHDLIGAIRDKAIGEAVGTVRARGADVWLIVDACSGGGLSRSAGGVARQMSPARLGITGIVRGGGIDRSGLVDTRAAAGSGRLVLFQAAAPGEIAWERTLADEQGHRARRGLFTWAFLRAWRSIGTDASFAGLAAALERERLAVGPPGGPALTTGDLAQPVLFAGAARDLLAIARAAAPLTAEVRMGIGASGRTCPGTAPVDTWVVGDAVIRISGCRAIAMEVVTAGKADTIVAWYRDAGGEMIALTGAVPQRLATDTPVRFDFVVSDHDPATGARLPTGREQVILLSEDGARGRVVEFDTGE